MHDEHLEGMHISEDKSLIQIASSLSSNLKQHLANAVQPALNWCQQHVHL